MQRTYFSGTASPLSIAKVCYFLMCCRTSYTYYYIVMGIYNKDFLCTFLSIGQSGNIAFKAHIYIYFFLCFNPAFSFFFFFFYRKQIVAKAFKYAFDRPGNVFSLPGRSLCEKSLFASKRNVQEYFSPIAFEETLRWEDERSERWIGKEKVEVFWIWVCSDICLLSVICAYT